MEIRGKKYKVLEIIKKSKFPEQDLFVCISEYGYKECFLGFDVIHPLIDGRTYKKEWTEQEKSSIKEMLNEGHSANYISYNLPSSRTRTAISKEALKFKKEMNK